MLWSLLVVLLQDCIRVAISCRLWNCIVAITFVQNHEKARGIVYRLQTRYITEIIAVVFFYFNEKLDQDDVGYSYLSPLLFDPKIIWFFNFPHPIHIFFCTHVMYSFFFTKIRGFSLILNEQLLLNLIKSKSFSFAFGCDRKNKKIFSWDIAIVKADEWLKHLQSFRTQHVKTNFSMSGLLLKTWVFFELNACITARAFLCCAILLCEHEKLLALVDLYCKCYAVCIFTTSQ